MKKNISAGEPRRVVAAIGEVWQLLKSGIDFPDAPHPLLHAELRELTAPHLPVLVHKRAKLTGGSPSEGRWFAELSDFVSRIIWPQLESNPVLEGRNKYCVAELLDEIVASEQRSAAELAFADALPRTQRFDTSWVL
jgi:hypothetical protein